MTKILSRIIDFIWDSHPDSKTSPTKQNGDGYIEVLESKYLSINDAEKGFYNCLLNEAGKTSSLSVPQRLVIEVVRENLFEKKAHAITVPRLPSVIPRLLRSIRDKDASAKDFVDIIKKDPSMSAAVLKLANSVYFNPTKHQSSSLEKAVVKLGIDGLRSVLSAAVMQPVIQRKSSYFGQFGYKLWQHCLSCAVASELIAKKRGLESFNAYIIGLSHDIGKITLFSELNKQFEQNPMDEKPGWNAFAPLLMEMSSQLSFWIAKDWELPLTACMALEQQINLATGVRVSPYAHILYQANLCCEVYAMTKADAFEERVAKRILEEFSLPKSIYDSLDEVTMDL